MWAENLPDWIGERTIYALDPLGDAGMSSQRVPLTSFEDQAEWISQTLTGLGLERAHIVGHSFGGANAAILAVQHPEQTATLTLLEPILVVEQLPASALFWATLTQLPVPQFLKDHALAEIGGVTVEEVRERTAMSVLVDTATSHYSTHVPLPRTLTDQEWQELTMPVRVDLAGMRSLAGGPEAARRLNRLLTDVQVTVWDHATHSRPCRNAQPSARNSWTSGAPTAEVTTGRRHILLAHPYAVRQSCTSTYTATLAGTPCPATSPPGTLHAKCRRSHLS